MIRNTVATFIFRFFLLLFSTLGLPVQANDLAEVRVLVKDESSKERNVGIAQGLGKVLVRISGQSNILATDGAQAILKQANQYMLQYSYESLTPEHKAVFFEENDEVANPDIENYEALKNSNSIKLLKLRFDQSVLVKRLQDQGFPVWLDQRPALLLWWVREDQGARKVISDTENEVFSSESKISSAFYYASEQKGLTIKLPLMDIQDQQSISVSEIWGGFEEHLQTASKRYQVSTYVNGRSYYENGKWHASWHLYLFGEKIAFESSDVSIYALHQRVVNSIAEYLASEYAISGANAENHLLLQVSGIRDINSYAALEDYFGRLVVIDSFSLVTVNGEQLTYLLSIKEDFEKLEKIFSFEKKIVVAEHQQLSESTQTEPLKIESVATVLVGTDGISEGKPSLNSENSSASMRQWFYRWNNAN